MRTKINRRMTKAIMADTVISNPLQLSDNIVLPDGSETIQACG